MHITANGEPVPLDEVKELDKNHPLWDEVCLHFLGKFCLVLLSKYTVFVILDPYYRAG